MEISPAGMERAQPAASTPVPTESSSALVDRPLPFELTDAAWARVQPLFPPRAPAGRLGTPTSSSPVCSGYSAPTLPGAGGIAAFEVNFDGSLKPLGTVSGVPASAAGLAAS